MMNRTLLLLGWLGASTSSAFAGFFGQYSGIYYSDTNDTEQTSVTTTYHMIMAGASMGKLKNVILGQSLILWSKSEKNSADGQEEEFSLLELGPRITVYTSMRKRFYISAAYHFYAQGTRNISGTEEDVEGTSYLFAMGYHFPLSKTSALGVSFNYHSFTASSTVTNNAQTDISNSYSKIFPTIDFSLRF